MVNFLHKVNINVRKCKKSNQYLSTIKANINYNLFIIILRIKDYILIKA